MLIGDKMVKNPEISVVITAYNKGRHIRRTVDSVLSQTFEDFEVIIIDDGSTDNTREIIASISDIRIRYIYQPNSGLPASARNKGMDLSQGKYIALLDGDDYWHEEKLKRCKDLLDNMPEISLVCHNIAFIYHGKTLKIIKFGPFVEKMYDKLLFEGNCLGPSAVVIRREVFFRDGFRFDEDKALFAIEDYEYWLRLSERYRFYFMLDVLGYYTATDCGAFSRDTEGNAVNMLRLLDSHFAKFKDESTGRLMRKRRSAVMCAAGRMYNHQKKFADSRRWYLKALNEYPFNLKAYMGVLISVAEYSMVYR